MSVRRAATRITALTRRHQYSEDDPRVIAARRAYAAAKIEQAIEKFCTPQVRPLAAEERARLVELLDDERPESVA